MPFIPIEENIKNKGKFIPIEPSTTPIKSPIIEEKQGFFGRMGSDIERRLGNIGESYRETDFPFGAALPNNAQTGLEFSAQAAGQGIGLAGDVLGNLAISGYRALAPESMQNYVNSGMQDFAQSNAGQALGSVARKYSEFEKRNPRAARNLAALGNIASVVPFGRATKAASGVLENSANIATKYIDDIIAKSEDVSSSALKKMSNEAYALADNAGAVIKPEAMRKYVDEITSLPDIKTDIGKAAAKKAGKITGMNQLESAREIINSMAKDANGRTVSDMISGTKSLGRPVSLRSFNEVDQTLSDMMYAKGSKLLTEQGTLNSAGQQVKAMQEALRDKVLNASIDDIAGDKSAFETLKSARELWRKQIKVREVEDVLNSAKFAQQPATAIKTGFKNLSKKTNLFNDAEMAVINRAADSGVAAEIFSMFGSRLPSVVATGTGDIATGALLRGASSLPRKAAASYQLRNAQELINTIAGVPMTPRGVNAARGGVRMLGNIGAVAPLKAGAAAMSYRVPQLTALGLINEQLQGE